VGISRTTFTLLVLAPLVAGCQPLSPGASQSLATPAGLGGDIEPRDDDTFTGRLKTSTKQMATATTKPFDRQDAQQKSLAKERQRQQQAAAKQRAKPKSGLTSWLFPEPKQPRTLSEWLSQDRPAS